LRNKASRQIVQQHGRALIAPLDAIRYYTSDAAIFDLKLAALRWPQAGRSNNNPAQAAPENAPWRHDRTRRALNHLEEYP